MEWTPLAIKSRRIAKGWDQTHLAAELGVSRRAITNWETGAATPRGHNLHGLDAVLGDPVPVEVPLSGASDAQLLAEFARRLALAEERAPGLR